MKLRDLLRTETGTVFNNWPPIWTHRQDPTDKPRGEIGNLQEVVMTEAADDILFIAIEYHDRRYVGAMLLDSAALCRQLYLLLQSRIVLSIEEIGALDLP